MRQEIRANFKQATVKGGAATLQFEVLPSAEGFMEVMRMTGGVVLLTVESDQQELPIEDGPVEGQATIYDAEVVEFSHALPEGGDEE